MKIDLRISNHRTESTGCRETLLYILNNTSKIDSVAEITLGQPLNKDLLIYVVQKCAVADKFIKDFTIVNDHTFRFTFKRKEIGYLHFISFLVLLCDPIFKNIKTRGKIRLKNRKTVSEEICKRVKDISYFNVRSSDSVINYTKVTLGSNEILFESAYNSGPEYASRYGQIEKKEKKKWQKRIR